MKFKRFRLQDPGSPGQSAAFKAVSPPGAQHSDRKAINTLARVALSLSVVSTNPALESQSFGSSRLNVCIDSHGRGADVSSGMVLL